MIFLLFLASLVTIEAILRHDEAGKRKTRQAPSLPAYDAAENPAGESILALMNGVEQHGRGVMPTIHTELAESKTPSAAA
jgi:hypothetical protein